MNCQVCSAPLPSGAKACPNCGTLTAAYYADSSASPYSPTTPAGAGSSSLAMDAPNPPTYYGSNPYATPLPPQYSSNPYVPPPPPPRRFSGGRSALIAIVAILLLVGSGGVYFATVYQPNQLHVQATAQAQRAATDVAQSQTNVALQMATTQALGTVAAQAQVTATATSFQNLFLTGTDTTPTIADPLSDNSKGLQWDEGQGCVFKGGAYHAINASSSSFQICMERKRTFANFIYQVQMTILKGSYGSLMFRSDNAQSNFYTFRIGQDGIYSIATYQGGTNVEVKHGASPSFKQGPNQTNLLTVFAQGSQLTFYVNAQYVYDFNDTTFTSGEIGLTSGSIGGPSEVAYNNVKVWVQS